MRVNDLELCWFFQRTSLHLERRESAHRQCPLETPTDVFCGDRTAIMEFGIFPQHEGHPEPIRIQFPAACEFRLELGVVIHGIAVGAFFAPIGHQPVISIPGHAIARTIGPDALNVEHVRAELVGHQQRVFLVLSLCGTARCGREQTSSDRAQSGRLEQGATIVLGHETSFGRMVG